MKTKLTKQRLNIVNVFFIYLGLTMVLGIDFDLNLVIAVVGIIISLIIGLGQYRRSTNARREREKIAIREIETVIAQFLVDDQGILNRDVYSAIIMTKNRQHNIKLSVSILFQIFEDIVTKFAENEFIQSGDKKNLILNTIKKRDEYINYFKPDRSISERKEIDALFIIDISMTILGILVVLLSLTIASSILSLNLRVNELIAQLSVTIILGTVLVTLTLFFIQTIRGNRRTKQKKRGQAEPDGELP